jgi:hypothetical protein
MTGFPLACRPGQAHQERSSLAWLGSYQDFPAVGFHNGPRDVQAQARSRRATGCLRAGPIVALEKAGNLFLGNPRPSVGHLYMYPSLVLDYPEGNPTSLWGELEGIGKEVGHHLAYTLMVSHSGHGWRDFYMEVYTGQLG